VSQKEILPLWDEFSKSPVSTLLRTPPHVLAAIKSNEKLFFPGEVSHYCSLPQRFETVFAIHVRRGDYSGSCQGFANWNSTFYSWSQLPGLPDPLIRGPAYGDLKEGQNTRENNEMVRRRCWPTDEEMVTKIHEVRHQWHNDPASEGKRLRTLYIMTNADKAWLNSFRERMILEGWDFVSSTADLVLDSDQMAVSNIVDMDIARQAAVFMGNGVCFDQCTVKKLSNSQ